MKFWQLIARKIIKIVAIGCQILRLKCTKIDFGWGFVQTKLGERLQGVWGSAYSAPPDSLAGIKGTYF